VKFDISKNHKFLVYCFEDCPYCYDAFALLSDLNIGFKKVTVDQESETWSDLKKAYAHQTAPMIFRNHGEDLYEIIGGFTDLKEYLNYYQEEDDTEEEE